MVAEQVFLGVIGLAAGGVVAAGVFAFLTALGLLERLADRTGTASRVRLYEDSIIAGGTFGNLVSLYEFSWGGGVLLSGAVGISYGIFVGCLIMSLAETLDAIPILCRRIRLPFGLRWIVWGLALGKGIGSLFYFFWAI